MKKRRLIAGMLICGMLATATPAMAARYYYDCSEPHAEICWENGNISAQYNQPITVHVDGEYLPTDVDPIMRDGRTFLPFRAAGEALDCYIDWDNDTRTVSALNEKQDTIVSLVVGSYQMFVGKISEFDAYIDNPTSQEAINYVVEHTKQLNTPATIINGRTLLPLRAFSEAFGAEVTWNQELYDVSIDTDAPNAPAPTIPDGVSSAAAHFIQKYYVSPSSSDLHIGSWQWRPSHSDDWQQRYLFVSELNGEYQFITLETTGPSSVTSGTADITKESAYLNPESEHTFLMATEYHNLIYFNGPYYGPIPILNENYLSAYYAEGNSLYRMGRLNLDNGEYAVYPIDIADKYTRF